MPSDSIYLKIPAKAEYILTVRMVVSSIASRLDFDMNTIEDLKAGAAEACILFLSVAQIPQMLDIKVDIDKHFELTIIGEGLVKNTADISEDTDMLAKCLIEEFYDTSDFVYQGDKLVKIKLCKRV